MQNYHATRNIFENSTYKENDVLVIFGELFSRGYANGLVEEAEKRRMKIIYATVGRREKDGTLRGLNSDEIKNPEDTINIPLEAGFDLEATANGQTVVDMLKDVKLSDWQNFKMYESEYATAKSNARRRFEKNTEAFVAELKNRIPKGANILFAHIMAGGVPRAKIILPLMNRVFKGVGERHIESKIFWDSDIGKMVSDNFNEVTAETFRILIEKTMPLREQAKTNGAYVSYLAFGYHGTEVLINDQYKWQTYTPYLQGWAKIRLEEYSKEAFAKGIHSCVYNCPEILTNSSSIFLGVELSLYSLLTSIGRLNQDKYKQLYLECSELLTEKLTVDRMLDIIHTYMNHEKIKPLFNLNHWPQHNNKEQMEVMLNASDEILSSHKDHKRLVTSVLSEIVFKGCGFVMINANAKIENPVTWINHDVLAKIYSAH